MCRSSCRHQYSNRWTPSHHAKSITCNIASVQVCIYTRASTDCKYGLVTGDSLQVRNPVEFTCTCIRIFNTRKGAETTTAGSRESRLRHHPQYTYTDQTVPKLTCFAWPTCTKYSHTLCIYLSIREKNICKLIWKCTIQAKSIVENIHFIKENAKSLLHEYCDDTIMQFYKLSLEQ